jgi:hypothetical protein
MEESGVFESSSKSSCPIAAAILFVLRKFGYLLLRCL